MELDPILLVAAALLAILAAVGWTVGVLFFALWMGEKGRRRDLALLTGRDAESAGRGHATIRRRMDPEEAVKNAMELDAVTEGLLEEAEVAGKKVSREDARKEARRLLREVDPINMSG